MHDEHDVAGHRFEADQRVVDLGGGDPRIRPRRDRDQVLAGGVHEDQGDTRRRAAEAGDLVGRDTLSFERGGGLVPEGIVPERGDQCDTRPETRGGDGLVAALAAVEPIERPAEHRLARGRQPIRLHDEVDVDRAHDDDPAAHRRPRAALAGSAIVVRVTTP